MLIDMHIQTWLLIGWEHSWQSISSHVKKALLIKMDFVLVILAPEGFLISHTPTYVYN